MAERQFYVHRTLKGTQVYRVTARSRADAVRKAIQGDYDEAVSFEITDAAKTGIAYEAGELDG